MKKISYMLIILLVLSLAAVAAEERVNLINDQTYVQQDSLASFEDGVLVMSDEHLQGEHLVNFNVPNLTNQYVWEGDITIKDIDTTKGYSGIRFCIGYDDETGNYLNLLLTRNMGVSANQRGATPVDDLIPLDRDSFPRDLEAGMTFNFEIIRDDAHVIMKIDGETVIDVVFPEEHNLFTIGDDLNLGFVSCYTTFEVKNLAVYDENVEITPVPTPTDTPEPTEEPTDSTPEPTSTPAPKSGNKDNGDSVSPVVIIVGVVAVIAAVGTVVYLINGKKK